MEKTEQWRRRAYIICKFGSVKNETTLLVDSDETKMEQEIALIEKNDRKLVSNWNGQQSADEQYNGVFDLSLIII